LEQPPQTFARRAGLLSYAALLLGALFAGPSSLTAQNGGRPRVYLDCQGGGCDGTYFRTEISWVNWVRDQNDAILHIIFTRQDTGAGGREYVLDFLGRGAYAGYVEQSRYQTLPTDTEREQLDGVTLTLSVGIAHFATQSGFRNLIQLTGIPEELGLPARQGIVSAEEAGDPWNLWIFRINANGRFDGESSRREWNLNAGLNANRVSPTWKQSYGASYGRNSRRIEYDDGRPPFLYHRTDWSVNWRVVYSLAEHFSAGFSGNVGRNERNNQDFWGQFNPAVEYSFFPYEEATRRSLTAFYEIGPVYRHYVETTLLGNEEETRFEQALRISLDQRQPWGQAGVNVRASHYLHDIHTNNLSVNGNLNFRIVRGFNVNLGGSYSRVRDRYYLPGGDLSDEERLLELRQLQTDYTAQIRFGFEYEFGSIYNNVVNNRF
jgi:hypothetical protein